MDKYNLSTCVGTNFEQRRLIKFARRELARVAAKKIEVKRAVEEEYDTLEKIGAGIDKFGGAIFDTLPRKHAHTMVFGDDEEFMGRDHIHLDDENMKLVAWRETIGDNWLTVIVERIPLENGGFQYRILQPDIESLSDSGRLQRIPSDPEVLADSHGATLLTTNLSVHL